MRKTVASIGFRTKTGKAIGVALARGNPPAFLRRWNLELWNRRVPETGQPHHVVMELPWPDARAAVRRYEALIENVATQRLKRMLQELRANGIEVRSIGVVGSPDRNLEKIGNRHIRAHAAEGMLFRRAIEVAAERCGVSCRPFSDRGLTDVATHELKFTAKKMDGVLRAIGQAAGRPWRVDERAAAAAAWMVL